MRKKLLAVSTVLAVMLVVLGSLGVAYANPTYYAALTAACPGAACTACHTSASGPPPFTTYGTAFSGIATHSSNPAGAIATLGCPGGTPPPPPPAALSLSLSPTSLPAGTQSTAYSQNVTMSATGGKSPYTFTCSGSGVAGLTASPSAAVCAISGTPTATGTFTVNFGVTDAAAATASSTLSFNVSSSSTPPPPPPPPPSSSAMPLPTGRQAFSYYPVDVPVVSSDPKAAKPIGVGPIAKNGDTVDIAVNVGPFESPVDVSFAVYAVGVDSADIFLLDMGFNLKPLSKAITEANNGKKSSSEDEDEDSADEHEGLVKWKTNVLSVNEHVFGPVATKDLAPGPYVLVLGVKPSDAPHEGHRSYLWVTYFIVP